MGQNSTGVAYNFGQMGSAYLLADDNTVTCPEGMAIVAITFATDSQVKVLVSKDANLFPNTVGAAHDRGHQTIQVDGTVSSANIQFNSDVTCASLGLKVGDEVYLTATGALLGTITVLNVGNTRTITISDTTNITDDHFVSILTPGRNDAGNEGVGGLVVTAGAAFSAGTTIYGRWDSLQLNDNSSAAIVYFGY